MPLLIYFPLIVWSGILAHIYESQAAKPRR